MDAHAFIFQIRKLVKLVEDLQLLQLPMMICIFFNCSARLHLNIQIVISLSSTCYYE